MFARRMIFPVAHFAAFGLATLLLAWATGGLSSSLINPDEGGHYVNALFLGDWIRAGFPAPMAFAQDYYAHFPRLSIGHWPPGWYMAEAPIFALLRPSPLAAQWIAAFVAGLPAVAILWAFARLGRARLGTGLALAYVLLPLTIDGARYVLLDQPVALVVALAAIAWARATDAPSWWRFLVFAALASFAPLVKGNGALIALVPALDIAFTGRWRLLRQPALWVAGLLALLVVAPWYWLSFRISAGGFNYAPGLDYAALALASNAKVAWANLGPAGLGLALIGSAAAVGFHAPEEARVARLSLAVVLATLVFQSLIPAALEPRYLTPLLPWLVVLAGLGLVRLARLVDGRWRLAAAGLAALALVPSLVALAKLQAKPDIGAPALARAIIDRGGLWLVDARSGGEGAIIAAAAHADQGHKAVWIARASQWLSSSDFMGRDYRLLAKTPAEARAVLDRIGAAGAVSIADRGVDAYPHSLVLHGGVSGPDFTRTRQPFQTGPGTVLLARRIAPVSPNVALIAGNGGSANVGKMDAMLR